jgi:hypothetical protein
VVARGERHGPARIAAAALASMGASVRLCSGAETLEATPPSHVATFVRFGGIGPGAARVERAYAAWRGAALLLGRGGNVHRAACARALTEGVRRSKPPVSSVLHCSDGWVVATWRNEAELALLRALLGGRRLQACSTSEVWEAGREARLLIAPVLRPRRRPSMRVVTTGPGMRVSSRGAPRVVDWTSLWAGPWATGALARAGAEVVRIEAPGRRDGYFHSRRALWRRWNESKRVLLLDAQIARDRVRLEALLRRADILVSSNTPRVLPNLGFGDEWFARNAPQLTRVSLSAFDEPLVEAPGLGEQAGAASGLMWRGALKPPGPPMPTADPLLAAWAFAVLSALSVGRRPTGLHVRLSLECAASMAMSLR